MVITTERTISVKRRKRFRLLLYAGIVVFVLVVITTSFVRAARTEYTTIEVVVHEGDTLWSIWEDVGYGRADKWISEVRRMNGMQSADIWPYDRLIVPVMKGE